MRRALGGLVFVVVLLGAGLSHAQEPGGCTWARDAGTTRDAILNGVDAVDPQNAWAVGYFLGGNWSRTLVRHWDGESWETQASPSVDEQTNILNDVAFGPEGTGWAVGERSRLTAKTVVQRYNGTRWRMQRSLNPSKTLNSLDAVDVSPTGTVYAAGTKWDRKRQHRTMIQRFDGEAWSVMRSGRLGFLRGIDAVADADVWAVGVETVDRRSGAYATHFDGTGWTRAALPDVPGRYSILNGVSAAATNDVWAVGFYMVADESHPLVLHYDGTAWSVAELPEVEGGVVELNDVSALDADTAVAVGERSDDAFGVDTRIVFEWDGTEWREAALDDDIQSNWLNAVDLGPDGEAWAVGYHSTRPQTDYLLHRTCA
ncbi:MAG TPA: hypothetical protein VG318_14245 [Actinomycetota bacterium]|nr:hypothetical protein [Actinomycetota bacterium]